MFPYSVKYIESEYDIQNNDLLYKIDQTYQNTFEMLENSKKFKNIELLFCILYKLHNPYFIFV